MLNIAKSILVCAGLFFLTTVSAENNPESQFPYKAEVIGSDVYVRSGSGIQYYFTTKLNEPAEVVVVDKRFSWCKVVPPAGSFSWIAKEFVKIDADNPGKGIVTNDNVMVWAGAPHLDPEDSTSPQTKLNKDQAVHLLGEESGDYYKISPPEGAYLWISGDYLKYVSPAQGVSIVKANEIVDDSNAVLTTEPVKADSNSTVVKVEAGKPIEEKQEPTFVSVVTREPNSPSETLMSAEELARTKEVFAVTKKIDAEFAKPIEQQSYTEIQAKLDEIIKDEKAGKAAVYAQSQLNRIEGYRLAVEAHNSLANTNNLLADKRAKIQNTLQQERAKIKEIEAYDLKGTFRKSMIYDEFTDKIRYIIFDDNGKMVCYAIPAGAALTYNLESFLGKKVGLIGSFSPDALSGIGVLRFEDIKVLE
jgi:hypothetical protein